MKIGLVGWGVETQSVFRYFGANNNYVIANEHSDDTMPSGQNIELSVLDIKKTKGDSGSETDLSYMEPLMSCEKIYYTPVAWPNILKKFGDNPDFLSRFTTMMQLFIDQKPKGRIIAVTGTKGKSTTTTLVHEVLKAHGLDTYLAGNIGKSPLDFLNQLNDGSITVLELSSYQLQNLRIDPDVSVLLPIYEEHLDWHKTMENYADAKSHITTNQNANNWLVYKSGNKYTEQIAAKSHAKKIKCFEDSKYKIINDSIFCGDELVTEYGRLKIKGRHNLENIGIALEATSKLIDIDLAKASEALEYFEGLGHRLQFVANKNGVSYYNDSIASAPEASLAGVGAFSEPVILAIGGHNRGIDITNFLGEIIKVNNLKKLILFGEVADLIEQNLKSYNYDNYVNTKTKDVEDVVDKAKEIATPGDVVLLSPGFSSYDNYLKFTERGEAFINAVNGIEELAK